MSTDLKFVELTSDVLNIYICIIVILFFGHISLCSHLFLKRRVGWAQFDRRAHVAGSLGPIRAVCRAWQAFKTFLALGTYKANPRVSAAPPGIGFLHPLYPRTYVGFECKPGFSPRRGYTFHSLVLHRAPRYDSAAQQQSSPLLIAAAACNSMRVLLLL